MTLVWGVVGYALYVYILLILARLVIDWTRQFARKWRPAGSAAIGLELVYVVTDPPIRLLRRLVPPLHLGTVSLDLSVIILLIVLIALRQVALTLS
ncbi:YggT family protein [uncultured Jatrophihabitans sp.]|uniref:YggT family protein n=1 Tax=uncultured Jatrophihabitans sp. TaxID=1610747 RepID=UPI0035CB50BA